jgi:hypothetical protein
MNMRRVFGAVDTTRRLAVNSRSALRCLQQDIMSTAGRTLPPSAQTLKQPLAVVTRTSIA